MTPVAHYTLDSVPVIFFQVCKLSNKEIKQVSQWGHIMLLYRLSIDLHYISIGDSAVVHISEGLRYNSGLELLLLADNPFGDDGGLNLTQVLCKENVSLKVLDIHGTKMSHQTEQKVFKHSFAYNAIVYICDWICKK